MSRKSRILDRASKTALRVANRWGVTLSIMTPTGAGGSTVAIKGFLANDQQTLDLHGGQTDEYTKTFIVPRLQTNFPTAMTPGAKITYDGVEYLIARLVPDADDLESCATVAIICRRFGYDTDLA